MHHLSNKHFPFSALVGQDSLKTALVVNAINPRVGGVLITGAKGTAKSTAARALAEVLPSIEVVDGCPYHCHPSEIRLMCDHCAHRLEHGEVLPRKTKPVPFVTLPLSATEDRVAGTIDVAHALSSGRVELKPGLLAEAHRGILYVDEVNLLDDHLVNILLDAAAMGRNIVEREGVSVVHPARFILIGTMNAEEGELRPQLLDRFGITVEVESINDVQQRVEILSRLEAWDRDPHEFMHHFEAPQEQLRERILRAMRLLEEVKVGRGILEGAAQRSLDAGVDGHRADLAMVRVASTLAAWEGETEVQPRHLDEAAPLVLTHRQRKRPFEPSVPPRPVTPPARSMPPAPGSKPGSSEPEPSERMEVMAELPRATQPGKMQGKRAPGAKGRGKKIGVGEPQDKNEPLDVAATLLTAAKREGPNRSTPVPRVMKEDLRVARASAPSRRMVVFVVDTSGSMGARQRLDAVKQAARTLLEESYQGRHRVALVQAGGAQATLTIPPTRDVERVERVLTSIKPGGKTPLGAALQLAHEHLQRARGQGYSPTLVVLTDGRANQPIKRGGDPVAEALEAAELVGALGADALVVDTENDFVNLGIGRDVATRMGADYLKCEAAPAGGIIGWLEKRA